MTKNKHPFIYWTPRILAILFILFLMVFSLDVFQPGLSSGQILLGLFMHNLPSLVLAIILWISWKYEIVGGISFLIAGLLHLIFSVTRGDVDPWYTSLLFSLILDGPAFLIGALFLVGWNKQRQAP